MNVKEALRAADEVEDQPGDTVDLIREEVRARHLLQQQQVWKAQKVIDRMDDLLYAIAQGTCANPQEAAQSLLDDLEAE